MLDSAAEKPHPAAHPRRPGHAVFRHAFVPGLLTLSAVSWIFREEAARLFRMDYTSAVLLLLIGCICLAEQAYPANPAWNYHLLSGGVQGWNRLGRDVLYLFVIAQVSTLLIKAVRVKSTLPYSLWPSAAPSPLRIILAFLVVEFFSYWLHRAAHHFQLLWRFHSTHHTIAEVNGLKALRTHPVDNVCFYVARSTPLMLMGAGPEEILAVAYLGSILGLLSHANVSVSEGYLGLLVNFPGYHVVHHSADVAESTSNFGCHTVIWDRVFGTFRSSARAPLEIGVHPVGPRSLWQELAEPFYRSRCA